MQTSLVQRTLKERSRLNDINQLYRLKFYFLLLTELRAASIFNTNNNNNQWDFIRNRNHNLFSPFISIHFIRFNFYDIRHSFDRLTRLRL